MTCITCIEDLRALAQRRVPRMFYDYADSGSWTESTYRANQADLQQLLLRQRVAIDIDRRSTVTTLLGQRLSMPLALAPVGALGMQHADGEILAARAARTFGVPFTLSTMSICSIEDVAEHAGPGFWFQLYVMRDRAFARRLVERARAAGCTALVLTLDLSLVGQRHKDLKNGLTDPSRMNLRQLLDVTRHPRWALGMAGTPRRAFGNVVGHAPGIDSMADMARWRGGELDPSLNWADVAEIRRWWDGPLLLKGIQDVDDARNAVAHGADAIVVSNHGGRQLDGTQSSIRALPPIVEAVGAQTEVWMDGGIRSGQDVLRARALGARGCLLGRAFVYGLGALGEAGVSRALEIIHNELSLSMAFCGHTDIEAVGPSILLPPCPWPGASALPHGPLHPGRDARLPTGDLS
ncbi:MULTISPECIES: alpha-hydroxy acid oxidase [unclassified Pseudomonas]|uniref:alpha-hydroxy acid oxidase n=1 Tax=unclassified Pseudomonas TaxID=196821 RepID=UPI0002A208A1|nr:MULTISPECIES: alpha-hydroxy acid oxidase [unclassified Pseudomonas]MBB1606894.1 alpha-hydroxy-acid oxidizing enzyme [Pseudomonas sp. UMC76]MBB1642262.1 alpha-hydroxy-acid oxidizing enzyme [Pseudomonas sp. UME83]NTX93067.1 alpha-hydroxy-acid oxidizing protein [Pseudomonas sp. UMA643]NTY22498.1 alpha-hydroxy-acid oxidizing protein [Pseudomonas sp. UMC3103]NTY28542.1 alpha-hydroxy-acid oxidizing protein [Pseudomonas sp. UMA603]